MADIADMTDERHAPLVEADIAAIRRKAEAIPKGKPGVCERCEEDKARIVLGVCARCRDRYNLP